MNDDLYECYLMSIIVASSSLVIISLHSQNHFLPTFSSIKLH